MIHHIKGDLFANTDVDAYAHGVNCKGVMGAGIAKEFKRRYPTNFKFYQTICERSDPDRLLGSAWCYPRSDRVIYNCFTQEKPGPFAKPLYVYIALGEVVENMTKFGLKSIAMPRIGCGLGGLKWVDVKPIIERMFGDSDIDVYVHYLED